MNKKSSSASLRISSVSLTSKEITNILGVVPTRSFEKGTLMSQRNPKSPIRDSSLWILESELQESSELSEHVEKLLLFVENHSDQIRDLTDKCEIDIYCGFFLETTQGGIIFSSKVLKRVASFPIDLVVDIYN